jgi:hypothetical protein
MRTDDQRQGPSQSRLSFLEALDKGCNNSNLRIYSDSTNKVDATIVNSVFDQACGHPANTPPYQIEGRDAAQIELSGPHTHVRVINCDFLPFSDGANNSSNGGINLGDTPDRVLYWRFG